MKIQIEEFEQQGDRWIGLNDGNHQVMIVEKVNALDFHLAKNAILNFGEMLTRHLDKAKE